MTAPNPAAELPDPIETTHEQPVLTNPQAKPPARMDPRGHYPGQIVLDTEDRQPDGGERNLAMLAHFGTFVAAFFFLGILAPIITYLWGSSSQFVRRHSQESINLNLTTYLLLGLAFLAVVASFLTGVFAFAGLGRREPALHGGLAAATVVILLLVLVGALLWAAYYLIASLRAGFAAMQGKHYHFKLCLPIVGGKEKA